MPATSEQALMKELKAIRRELAYIKKHMVDSDTLLTPDEKLHLEASLREFRDGKTKTIQDLERDRRGV